MGAGVEIAGLHSPAAHSVIGSAAPVWSETPGNLFFGVLLEQNTYIDFAHRSGIESLIVFFEERKIRQKQWRNMAPGQILLRLHDFTRSGGHALQDFGESQFFASRHQQITDEFHAFAIR